MRKFRITVNGKEYEVGVEEVSETRPAPLRAAPAAVPAPATATVKAEPAPAPKVEAPKPAAAAAPAPAARPAPAAGKGSLVSAPMPGTISDILVKEGDRVKRGQVLVMLEAMKMQNEIMAPYDAIVTSVHTTRGASVNTGDPLVVLTK